MTPGQILVAMADVYATCPTYRDKGQVTTQFYRVGRHQARTDVRPFATAFCRPDQFRFEYQDRSVFSDKCSRHIVWANGSDVRTWWDVRPGVEKPESLGLALGAATGVSGGSAHTIPALLLPDPENGIRLTELIELSSLGDARLGDVTCYRLSGRFQPYSVDPAEEEQHAQEVLVRTGRRPERSKHSPVTVWIDCGTLLVRRIEDAVQFETFRTENVTEYEPAIGVTLSDDELQFDAPQTGEPCAAPDRAI